MIEHIKRIFGMGSAVDYRTLVKKGAIILDVRTTGEYIGGHIIDSLNIPINQLKRSLHQLSDKQIPIITCCASGARSASAQNILKSSGYAHVYNGGGWIELSNKI